MTSGKGYIIGVDLGGTRYRVAIADTDGIMVSKKSFPTDADKGKDSVISRIVGSVREVSKNYPTENLFAVGIGVPGPVEPWSGIVYSPPNLPGWGEVPIKEHFQNQLKLPVYVGNDANLAALGEHRFGAGAGVSDMVYITVSTGIGGGVIANGKLLLGTHGLAGEIGHMTIDRNGPRCPCGNIGCLEALASGTSIARIARERLESGEQSLIIDLIGQDLEKVTGEVVVEAARKNDRLAMDVMETAAENLGIGVVNVVHIFNPALVIIGGGVSNAEDLIFQPVIRIVRERVMSRLQEGLAIVPAALGDDAGLFGAIALAMDPGVQ